MLATRSKPRQKRLNHHKARPIPAQSVQNLLLNLAYNLHATRVVGVVPAEPKTAIQ